MAVDFEQSVEFVSIERGEIDRRIYQLRVDTLGAEAAALRSVDDGKRSPVETF